MSCGNRRHGFSPGPRMLFQFSPAVWTRTMSFIGTLCICYTQFSTNCLRKHGHRTLYLLVFLQKFFGQDTPLLTEEGWTRHQEDVAKPPLRSGRRAEPAQAVKKYDQLSGAPFP